MPSSFRNMSVIKAHENVAPQPQAETSREYIACTIGVVTYKRTDLLEKLLQSLEIQEDIAQLDVKLVIVDNDPEESARSVVDAYRIRLPFRVQYVIQPLKNISISRNQCVAQAEGKYLLFIDDDEYAEPDWLATMVRSIEALGADAVFGRVSPYFHPDAPEWLQDNFLYYKNCGPTGSVMLMPHTANSIVKLSVLRSMEGPFDLRYGKSSGEDTHLFHRIRRSGGQLMSCYESQVREFVPLERSNEAWLLQRARRTGNIYTRRQLDLEKMPGWMVKIIETGKAGINLLIANLMKSISAEAKRKLYWKVKAASNQGRLIAVFNKSIEWGKSLSNQSLQESPYS